MNKGDKKRCIKCFETWYDWSFFLKLMSDKLFYDSKNYINFGCHELAEEDGKKMKECAELLRRVYKEEYSPDRFGDDEKQKDLEVALDIIRDNVFCWWD